MVEVIAASGGPVFRLKANLVMENCRDFFEVFQENLEAKPSVVLLDFSQIRFIDSSGIGILLRCAETTDRLSAKLLIFGLNRQLEQVFKLAGLLKVFETLTVAQVKEGFPELPVAEEAG